MDDLNWLIFQGSIDFKHLSNLYKHYCSNDSAELDKLFDEVHLLKETLQNLESTDFLERSVEDRWAIVFKNKEFVLIKKLVSIFLSIFASNAFCESVFSVVNSIWTDERNRFSLKTVNSYLIMTC